jgi:hypothetical protein
LKRVKVSTPLFAGWATVADYFAGEMYPIQIALDEPDADGHAIKRVAKADIIQYEEENE